MSWIIDSFSDTAKYAVFDCSGGVSSGDFDSLNVGESVGDTQELVLKNRERIKKHLNLRTLWFARQVHGVGIHRVNSSSVGIHTAGGDDGCDALVTNLSGIGLVVQHADCQPVLLHDPVKNAVAAIHNGWRGSVQNILASTLDRMRTEFGSNPSDIKAFIGPSIGPCCGEFVDYRDIFPEEFRGFAEARNHFNFWAVSRWQLEQSGLLSRNIFILGSCTVCSEAYFSYRRACRQAGGVTGRNCSVIYLE